MRTFRIVLLTAGTEVLVAAGLHWLVVVPAVWSVLLGLPVAAVLLLYAVSPHAVDPSWQPLPTPPAAGAHLEAGTLANRLADAMADPSRFRSRIQPRLARIALARLRRLPGTGDLADLRDERAAALLGRELHTLLTGANATMPDPKTLVRLLHRLEEL